MKKTKRSTMHEKSKLHGFFRLNVVDPDGKVAGDSGWVRNAITQTGYQQYLQFVLIASAGSKTVSHAVFGGSTVPGSTDATLLGQLTETAAKVPITTGTIGSQTVQFTFTLSSGVIAAASTIGCVGLVYCSNQSIVNSNEVMMAATNYATSSLATNQAVNGTLIKWRHLQEIVKSKFRKFGEQLIESIPSQAFAF